MHAPIDAVPERLSETQSVGASSGQRLFKYLDFEGLILTLLNGTLRFQTPKEFNDLHDCGVGVRVALDSKEQIDAAITHVARRICHPVACSQSTPPGLRDPFRQLQSEHKGKSPDEPGVIAAAEQLLFPNGRTTDNSDSTDFGSLLRDRYRVACFSERDDSPAMWGHYTGMHSGGVLEFDVPDRKIAGVRVTKVNYADRIPGLRADVLFDNMYGLGEPDLRETVVPMFLTKSADWSYEKEWRAVTLSPSSDGNSPQFFKFDPPTLKSITLGIRLSEGRASALATVVRTKYPNAVVRRAEVDRRAFRISASPIR